MNREKTLVKNTLIITIGKICTQLITFLLLPLYTGILSTEEYGVVDLLNTLYPIPNNLPCKKSKTFALFCSFPLDEWRFLDY